MSEKSLTRNLKISALTKSELKSKVPTKIPNFEIISLFKGLYLERNLSQREIGLILGIQGDTVRSWLNRCKIPLRDRYDFLSYRLTRYKTNEFSGNLNEKAYLLGIRSGDLSAQKHGRKIRLTVTTTHPAMLRLFKSLFSKYGRVNIYPKYDKSKNRYLTCIYSDLDKSFSFLISKLDKIPVWILKKDEYFISFLSGYFDAEGCISIAKNNIQLIIKSCDKGILNDILIKLRQMNLILRLRLDVEADGKNYRKDYWYLGTGKKTTVLKLVKRMKLRHEEKIAKTKILDKEELELENMILRKQIEEGKIKSMENARIDYLNSHKLTDGAYYLRR